VAALKEEELDVIGKYVKTHLNEWLGDTNVVPFSRQIDIVERITTVETGIISLQEQLKQQLGFMEKRFDQVDKRFEQVEKRFEQMQINFDKRFEQLQANMDKRFEQVDKRFEQVDKRFEQVDKRFEQVNVRFKQMFAYFTTSFIILAALMSLYQFLG